MTDIALQDCGPCLSGAGRVVDHLPGHLSATARQVIEVRLSHGAALYGQPLRLGWAPAPIEAVQEAADLVAYLVSAGAPEGLLDAETNLHYAGKYLRGAWLVSGRNEDRAMMW